MMALQKYYALILHSLFTMRNLPERHSSPCLKKLKYDYTPAGICFAKAFENEINLSIVHWIRQKLGVTLPDFYNQFDTNLGDDIGHVPDNINVKNPRKIYFNKKDQKSDKWIAPGMNESQICFQSIIINENANPLLFDDTKIKASLTQWSKIGSIRNSIAHTYLVDATTIYSIIAAFKELNRLEFFSKAYVLKNQLRN
jgi:uncharacterized protein with HEPN domain